MARAKRTDRAEARRRYRASLAEEELELAEADAADEVPPRTAKATLRPPAGPPLTAPPARASIGGAFRGAFRPLDLRSDLRALPRLLIDKSVWVPLLLTVGSALAFGLDPAGGIGTTLLQFFVWTPPVGSIFLAGFLAPRASYLTGFVAGLVGGLAFAAVVASGVGPFGEFDRALAEAWISGGLLFSPLAGIFFGAAAGWYRRFLALANPNRAARRPPSKPGGQRRKGSDGRPMLARRR